jgi:hypothetical protein
MCKNKQSRFCNRKRKEGWLTPTATQLLRTHINLVKKLQKFLPISEITLELNKFDFAKMENPNIKNWEYQKGKLFGYKDKNDYIKQNQENHCLFCKKSIEDIHHVIWKSRGGSDTIDNLVGVCKRHHNLIHTNTKWDEKCKVKHQGQLKKYGALSVLNQIKNQLVEQLSKILPLNVTTGYETYRIRNDLDLMKDHYIDAWCIAVSSLTSYKNPIIENKYDIHQYRRHDRRIIARVLDRQYLVKKKVVCKNRHKRYGQTCDSLEEYAKNNNLKNIEIKKGRHAYKNMNRILPGAVFIYNGKRYVMNGSCNGYAIYSYTLEKAVNIKNCIFIKRNTGLVFS